MKVQIQTQIWSGLPLQTRRIVVFCLSQIACRQWQAPSQSKEADHERQQQSIVAPSQDSLPPSRASGGGVRAPVHPLAADAASRVDPAPQYALVDRALRLGWSRADVLVIDEDLGKSGSTVQGRSGLQRLVSEVSLNRVGLVLGN